MQAILCRWVSLPQPDSFFSLPSIGEASRLLSDNAYTFDMGGKYQDFPLPGVTKLLIVSSSESCCDELAVPGPGKHLCLVLLSERVPQEYAWYESLDAPHERRIPVLPTGLEQSDTCMGRPLDTSIFAL